MKIHPLPAFEDNYIWLLQKGDAAAVVDPGESAPVMRHLEAHETRLCAILVTHRHGDHTGGIADLIARHPVPVFGPAIENIAGIDRPLGDGDRFVLPGFDIEFDVLGLPGHTHGHVAYYRPGVLFCGDVLFGAGCGRVFEGTMGEMRASLARLAALPPETSVYCAHEYTQSNLRFARAVEPDNAAIAARIVDAAKLRKRGLSTLPSTIGLELATNPFLRLRAPTVVAAAAKRLGHAPVDDVEIFKSIREWRNVF
ncbi:MAG: hydroxyacylglutathione hydrolase [Candidatus Nitricoxidivorans perseverans]|uniref:Hydroxyacylglutathione hydrolase n=1 Tax=Candidatus Nitricoxidivorans perseverans TaxID=2975601 RepID=A0AA49FMI4_9PROT|nr:MAG: hydroxyacylglutathione hydrolase [Candidatus Nitricoxidivorans perseverans]